jgi:hypothetical protein
MPKKIRGTGKKERGGKRKGGKEKRITPQTMLGNFNKQNTTLNKKTTT